MAKLKIGGGKTEPTKFGKAANFPQLSASMFKEMMSTIRSYNDTGASNFLPAYYSANWTNDFLHSAGLITDQCYQDNRLWGDIFAGTTAAGDVITSLFGSGGLAPTLRTKVIQNAEGGGTNELEASGLAALVPEVATVVG